MASEAYSDDSSIDSDETAETASIDSNEIASIDSDEIASIDSDETATTILTDFSGTNLSGRKADPTEIIMICTCNQCVKQVFMEK